IEQRSYQEALTLTRSSKSSLERLLGKNGVIVGPAASGPAPDFTTGTGSPDLSRPWQLLGLPVVVVPGAKTTTGLPLGIQLIGLSSSGKVFPHPGRSL